MTTPARKGKFIVIDGPDATGKKTQTGLLVERLRREGVQAVRLAFPRYDNDSSYLIRLYLGREGPSPFAHVADVGPYFASTFFAYDRWKAAPEIREMLEGGTHVICDRYLTANMGHQGGLIDDAPERARFYEWVRDFEYNRLGIPKPDLTLFLRIDVSRAMQLLESRLQQKLDFTNNKNKIVERDSLDERAYQERAHEAFEEVATLYKKEITTLWCHKNGMTSLLTPEEVHEEVWRNVKPLLAA